MRYRRALVGAVLLATGSAIACAPALGGRSSPAAPASGPAAVPGSPPSDPSDPLAPLPPLAQKLTVSYASVTTNYAPAYVAAESGLFAKHGLDVDLTLVSSGPTSIQSLVAGELQFAVAAAVVPAAAYANGAPVQIVLGWTPVLDTLFMVDPSITSPEQLRGKPIGVTRFGGLPHVAAKLALRRWGLDPENDVHYLQMGGTPEILVGMQQGIVVGGVYAHPTNLRAQQLGFRVLGDLSQMDIPYQSGIVVAVRSYVEGNPEVTREKAFRLVGRP